MAHKSGGNDKTRDISRNDLPTMHPSWRWTSEELKAENMTPDQKQEIIDRMWEEFDE
jgi:hypothetical protein